MTNTISAILMSHLSTEDVHVIALFSSSPDSNLFCSLLLFITYIVSELRTLQGEGLEELNTF